MTTTANANVSIVVTFTNEVGFSTGIPSDQYDASEDVYKIKSLWEGTTFSVDIQYSAYTYDEQGGEIEIVVTDNECSYDFETIGMTYTKLSNNTARISGTTKNVFPDAYYRFRMVDGTFKVLNPDTTEDFYALVKYKMPSNRTRREDYPIKLTVQSVGEIDIDIIQWHYWRYQSADKMVKSLVARSKH